MKKRALLVGTQCYADESFARLQAPEVDVAALAAVLSSPQVCGFDSVSTVVDRPSHEVMRAVSAFFAGSGREDLLLLYISGHGTLDAQGRLFFCLTDTYRTMLWPTALAAASVRDEMDSCRCRTQVLILDCCHSGAFERGAKGSTIGTSVGTMSRFAGSGVGRIVLTSSDATQLAFEGDRVIGESTKSLFTHYLVEGLESGRADTNGDGEITVDELYDYAYSKVVHDTSDQTPGKWTFRQQGSVILAKNPNPVALPELIDQGLLDSLAPSKPLAVRSAAIQELAALLKDKRPGLVLAAQNALGGLATDDSRTVSELVQAILGRPPGTPPFAAMRPPSSRPAASAPSSAPPAAATLAPAATHSLLGGAAVSVSQAPVRGGRQRVAGASALALALTAAIPSWYLSTRTSQPPVTTSAGNPPAGGAAKTQPIAASAQRALDPAFAKSDSAPVKKDFALSAAPPSASTTPASLQAILTVSAQPSLGAVRCFLVTDGVVKLIEHLPFSTPLVSGKAYTLSAYWRNKQLTKPLDTRGSISIELSESDSWSAPKPYQPSPSRPPPPQPFTVVSSVVSGLMMPEELSDAIRPLVGSLRACMAGETSGQMTFQVAFNGAGVVSGVMRSRTTALSDVAVACAVQHIKAYQFPKTLSDKVTVKLDVTVRQNK
jgi:hypothetical protein